MALQSKLKTQDRKTRVFISYSRKDKEFAQLLHDQLEAANFQPMLDQTDIAPGEAWQERLSKLILQADAFVFCVSPNSAASKICHWEVDESQRLAKRLVPVVVDPVDTGDLPESVSKLNFIFFSDSSFEEAFGKLQTALNSDLGWLRQHTKIAELADEWEARGRPKARLLYGQNLTEAENWVAHQPTEATPPSPAQLQFIAASRKSATTAQRYTMAGAIAVVIGALSLAAWGEINRQRATAANEKTQQAYVSLTDASSNMVGQVSNKFKDLQGFPPEAARAILENALSIHDIINQNKAANTNSKTTELAIIDSLIDVIKTQGDTPAAFYYAQRAEKLSSDLAIASPKDEDAQLDHAVMLEKVAEIKDSLGAHGEAKTLLLQARDAVEELLKTTKNATLVQGKLAAIYGSLGSVLLNNNDLEQAENALRLQVEYGRKVASKININLAINDDAQMNLAAGLEQLGAFLRDQTDDKLKKQQAVELFREDLNISERLASGHDADISRQSGLALAYSNLGRGLIEVDDKIEAEKNLLKFWEMSDDLARKNTERGDLMRLLGIADNQLGSFYFNNNQRAKAELYLSDDLRIARFLLSKDQENAIKQLDVAKSLYLVSKTQSDPRKSLEEAKTYLATLIQGGNATPEEAGLSQTVEAELAKLPSQ
jgi:TIR domain